jgi:molybdenum cofactor cytidylyltransferase
MGVVCAARDSELHKELDRLGLPTNRRIVNPNPEQGMFSSVQCAARWRLWESRLTHWAIVLGDQPHLALGTLRALIDHAAKQPGKICQPSRRGRPRHPVLLPKKIFQELAGSQDENLKQFLQARSADLNLMEMDDPGLDLDIDRPEDYAKVSTGEWRVRREGKLAAKERKQRKD